MIHCLEYGFVCILSCVHCFGIVTCKQEDSEMIKKHEKFPLLVLQLMYDMFGIKNVQQSDDKMIHVTLDNNTAKLDPLNVVSIHLCDHQITHTMVAT